LQRQRDAVAARARTSSPSFDALADATRRLSRPAGAAPPMRTVRTIADCAARSPARARPGGASPRPTMGAFHEGHLRSSAGTGAADVVVVSLFVNPTQFRPGEDLASYPRRGARRRAGRGPGADLLFAPGIEEVYPDGFARRCASTGR